MFFLIQVLLIPAAWWLGKIFANYFEGRKPPKLYAAIFSIVMSLSLFGVFAALRYLIAGLVFNDPSLQIRVVWFGPLDPPAVFLYMLFGYGGGVSYYASPRP
jgi:hypothetical protein